jgi:hypothetical protein
MKNPAMNPAKMIARDAMSPENARMPFTNSASIAMKMWALALRAGMTTAKNATVFKKSVIICAIDRRFSDFLRK